MNLGTETITEKETIEDIDISDLFTKKLVLYNDDYNTFDHVINCLVKYCKHSEEQAEQCATMVHTKGKAVVKESDETTLKPMKEALCDNGLSAKIE